MVLAECVCFPVDPETPEFRLRKLLKRAKVRYVLSYRGSDCYKESQSYLRSAFNTREHIKLYETIFSETVSVPDRRVAHLFHTSGSTGELKLVQIPGAILHPATSTKVTPLRPHDKTLLLNNPSLDLALFEV